MVVVAVAGGVGNVGRTIVEVLSQSTKHEVIILARTMPEDKVSAAPVYVVDYGDIQGVAELLARQSVHTVISTISVTSEAASAAEVNLIKAAAKSSTAKRFIATGWGALPTEASPVHAFQAAANVELRNTGLEWTRFAVGYFLDYYGMPYVKTHLRPLTFVVDMANKTAGIPGTGNDPMAFTYSLDVARFVEAALDLPKWEETSFCYGEKTTWNSFVQMAEEARGSKFTVTYDSVEKLQKGEVTELPGHIQDYAVSGFPKSFQRGLYALLGSFVINGLFDIPVEKSLNNIFPAIQPMKVKEMLSLWKDR